MPLRLNEDCIQSIGYFVVFQGRMVLFCDKGPRKHAELTWSNGPEIGNDQLEWLFSRKGLRSQSSRDRQRDRKWIIQSLLLRTEELSGRGVSGMCSEEKEKVYIPEEETQEERKVLPSASERPSQQDKNGQD